MRLDNADLIAVRCCRLNSRVTRSVIALAQQQYPDQLWLGLVGKVSRVKILQPAALGKHCQISV